MFKELFETQQWVIIYDKNTGKADSKRWSSHKDAKKALTKYANGVIASVEWFHDNQDDIASLQSNAKRFK